MARTYMSVRLSYEAKYWLELLQRQVQQTLDDEIGDGESEEIESLIKKYLEGKKDVLGAVSITTILKVSASSIIEDAFSNTKDYTLEKWRKLQGSVGSAANQLPKNKNVGTMALRLYLDDEIITGLEKYQEKFMLDDMVRVARMSYVIKVVVYAYYLELNKDQ